MSELGPFALRERCYRDVCDLVAETNTEGAYSTNEIPVRTHGSYLAYSVTNLNRADLRSGERNHFSELTGSN